MIIGLTGKNAAGKGEAAAHLKKKGFEYHSLSDVLREEATKRGIEHTRDNLISLGNKLRTEFGANYLAKKINRKMQSSHAEDFVVDSIRSPYEIEELRKNRDFVLVAIDAPAELRFERLLKRGRLGDAATLEEFKMQEEKENLNNPSGQQLDKCISMADQKVVNDGQLEHLHQKIDKLIKNV